MATATCLIQGGRKSELYPNPQYPFSNFGVSNWNYIYTKDGSAYEDPEKYWARLTADPAVVWAQVICSPVGGILHSHGVPTTPAPVQPIPGVSPTPGSGGSGGASAGDSQVMVALKRHKGSLVVIAGGLAVLLYLRRGKRKRR